MNATDFRKELVKTFKGDGAFQAFYAAERWCRENGYSIGAMDGSNPIAIMRGDNIFLPKWHNLKKTEIAHLTPWVEIIPLTALQAIRG